MKLILFVGPDRYPYAIRVETSDLISKEIGPWLLNQFGHPSDTNRFHCQGYNIYFLNSADRDWFILRWQ